VGRALFGLACCVVLVLTFMLGALVGRQWARSAPPVLDEQDAGLDAGGGPTEWLAADRRERRPAPSAGTDPGGSGGGPGAWTAAGRERAITADPSGHGSRGDAGPRVRAAEETGHRESRGAGPALRPSTTEARRARERDAGGTGDRESRGARGLEAEERATTDIQQKLTFYQTLTAPLAAAEPPPPAPRPGGEPAPHRAPVAAADRLPAPPAHEVYTVQVAALATREQALALRQRLGPDAYVIHLDGASGARYRVRVGAFASRAEADLVAARLRADHALTAFVTTTTR
jgi:cell division septation protein DedD